MIRSSGSRGSQGRDNTAWKKAGGWRRAWKQHLAIRSRSVRGARARLETDSTARRRSAARQQREPPWDRSRRPPPSSPPNSWGCGCNSWLLLWLQLLPGLLQHAPASVPNRPEPIKQPMNIKLFVNCTFQPSEHTRSNWATTLSAAKRSGVHAASSVADACRSEWSSQWVILAGIQLHPVQCRYNLQLWLPDTPRRRCPQIFHHHHPQNMPCITPHLGSSIARCPWEAGRRRPPRSAAARAAPHCRPHLLRPRSSRPCF